MKKIIEELNKEFIEELAKDIEEESKKKKEPIEIIIRRINNKYRKFKEQHNDGLKIFNTAIPINWRELKEVPLPPQTIQQQLHLLGAAYSSYFGEEFYYKTAYVLSLVKFLGEDWLRRVYPKDFDETMDIMEEINEKSIILKLRYDRLTKLQSINRKKFEEEEHIFSGSCIIVLPTITLYNKIMVFVINKYSRKYLDALNRFFAGVDRFPP